MLAAPVVAVIAPGFMGAAVAARLTHAGCTVLTELAGRSPATIERARAAGMQDAPLGEIAARSDWILSILPPRDALALAKRFRAAWRPDGAAAQAKTAVYVDCNAVNPETARAIAGALAGAPGLVFLDGGIIGGPPSPPSAPTEAQYDPAIYASADPADEAVLDSFVKLGGERGLRVVALKGEGAGIGDASALKMSYAGISKGLIGIFTTMILSAHASSPATASALLHELHASQPALLRRLTGSVPPMLPKAYRFSGEMEEIAGFVGGTEGAVYSGFAAVYERVAASVREGEAGGEDVKTLTGFVEEAKKVLGKDLA